jgi:aminoglycoside phosphotransferase (APT) family kinase protein
VAVDAELVTALLADQHPDLAGLRLGERVEGWDNVTFRLGDTLAVRIPRRAMAAPLIRNEQRFLPALAARLDVAVPAPVRTGRPGRDYPWHWSVVPWISGRMWLATGAPSGHGRVLGRFLRQLHGAPHPAAGPRNPYRGVPLGDRPDDLPERLQRLRGEGLVAVDDRIARVLRRALDTPVDVDPVWLHGDLHAKNVIVADGAVAGVIDWGDVCAGDPATDLSAAWTLCTAGEREAFWAAYGPASPATRLRAQGWTVAFGLMLVDSHHVADPAFAAAGRSAIDAVLSDPA